MMGLEGRIAQLKPTSVGGHVTGYLVLGGTSRGFAFGGPEFFLDLDRFPSRPWLSRSCSMSCSARFRASPRHRRLDPLGLRHGARHRCREGAGAIADLTGEPGALFVQRYRNLKSYGKSNAVPLLKAETIRSGEQLAACAA
ncbi:MAG: hypothetical protein EOP94_00755 [Zymomonas sp.]|nr:MAG: hypothetical protein EOP94_00755 [Zymomonas sp.]